MTSKQLAKRKSFVHWPDSSQPMTTTFAESFGRNKSEIKAASSNDRGLAGPQKLGGAPDGGFKVFAIRQN